MSERYKMQSEKSEKATNRSALCSLSTFHFAALHFALSHFSPFTLLTSSSPIPESPVPMFPPPTEDRPSDRDREKQGVARSFAAGRGGLTGIKLVVGVLDQPPGHPGRGGPFRPRFGWPPR